MSNCFRARDCCRHPPKLVTLCRWKRHCYANKGTSVIISVQTARLWLVNLFLLQGPRRYPRHMQLNCEGHDPNSRRCLRFNFLISFVQCCSLFAANTTKLLKHNLSAWALFAQTNKHEIVLSAYGRHLYLARSLSSFTPSRVCFFLCVKSHMFACYVTHKHIPTKAARVSFCVCQPKRHWLM